jgi:hypothetical protein
VNTLAEGRHLLPGSRPRLGVCGQKGADHALTGDAAVGVAGEQAKGAVMKPVEDLHIAAIG